MIRSKFNGKRMFGVGMMLVLLTAVLFWQVNVREGQAQSGGGFNSAILVVTLSAADLTALTSGGSATSTAVAARGAVTTQDGEGGDGDTVRVWGVKQLVDGATVATVNFNFELPSFNGTLTGQGTLARVIVDGISGDDVFAITGGTGTFRGANGEGTVRNNGDGTFTFRLKEAKRR
jgi:hypothetical protein